MEFTKTQLDAISAFKSFLKDDEQVFMLKGAAGTGKTTLVSEFIKILDSEKRKYSLMAPTGRYCIHHREQDKQICHYHSSRHLWIISVKDHKSK